MIWVVGLPSGGTSVGAGVLHHLGVDMGNIATRIGPRGYLGYECRDLTEEVNARGRPIPYGELFRLFREYIIWRGPNAGIKNAALMVLGLQDDVKALPVEILHVRRDVGETLRSDLRYTDYGLKRASWMGLLHCALVSLLERIPARHTVDFDALLADPILETERIANAFGLAWQPAASAFVDPVNRGKVAA